MSKTKTDKMVNRIAREVNKIISKDVYGDRFYLHQLRKDSRAGYYLYELCDKEQPNRNTLVKHGWIWGGCPQVVRSNLFEEMNSFIVNSDFWHKKSK